MIQLKDNDATQGAPDLTALIDIVFIVVVFLLITANTPLLTLPLDLPTTDSALSGSNVNEPLVISVTKEPSGWQFDNQHFERWEQFRQQILTIESPEQAIVIAADRDASIEHLLKLLALLQAHHFSNLQLVMEQQQ